MQELDELRPAPRRTPTAVLWLMGLVVTSGSLLLLEPVHQGPGPVAPAASLRRPLLADGHARPAARASALPASSAPPNLSELQVP